MTLQRSLAKRIKTKQCLLHAQDGKRHVIVLSGSDGEAVDLIQNALDDVRRGPVWMPMNYLLIEALQRLPHYYGDSLSVESRRARATGSL